jgi:hypothetical protein
MLATHDVRPYHPSMLPSELTQDHTRTLTLVLRESEWRALRDVEPDAIGWLQLQIRDRLTANGAVRQSPPPINDADDYPAHS